MNKRIRPWYIAALGAELLSAAYEVFLLLYSSSPFDSTDLEDRLYAVNIEAITLCAGVWLPLLAAFIGSCLETKLKVLPIAVGITFAAAGFGIWWEDAHPTGWLGSLRRLPISLFYGLCFFVSLILLIIAVIRAIILRKTKYAEFLAEPNVLFTKKGALWLIPLAFLTAVCFIPALNGYLQV